MRRGIERRVSIFRVYRGGVKVVVVFLGYKRGSGNFICFIFEIFIVRVIYLNEVFFC